MFRWFFTLIFCFWGSLSVAVGSAVAEGGGAWFLQKVAPILEKNCAGCHSHGAGKSKAGLMLDSRKAMLKGGDSGPAMVVGDGGGSRMVLRMRAVGSEEQMPPDHALAEEEIAVVERWITGGAVWPEVRSAAPVVLTDEELAAGHWAYQPLQAVAVPVVPDGEWRGWVRSPIDAFIAEKLQGTGVTPGVMADGRTLARRMSYDLTGLPPPEDGRGVGMEALLASKEYGRRWGRHWLDVVRYADTAGDNADFPVPEMALYRDYVVDAFNADLRFDEFVKEQIAGDLMDAGGDVSLRRRRVIATSFIAGAMRFCDDFRLDMPLVIGDTLDTFGQAFMGMTLACARCHHHKYDPIPASDYYRLYGFFSSTRYPHAGREGRQFPFNLVSTGCDANKVKRVEELNAFLETEVRSGKRVNLHNARGQKILAAVEEQRGVGELAFGVRDAVKTGDAAIHLKGEPKRLGEVVPRGFLTFIGASAPPVLKDGESGRRQLAEWVASPRHPLTARVMVNRIWQWHFGQGLVVNANYFGVAGEAPSHPELLDYLAGKFIESGWSVKAMHRLIMDTAVYRQAWRAAEEGVRADSGNRLLWRFDRRRLTAEEIRDALLVAAGQLDLGRPRGHGFPSVREFTYTQHKPYEGAYEHRFRSVYLMTSRIRKQEFLTLFDGADPTQSTAGRRASTVPLQSLYLLNDERMQELSRVLAGRSMGVEQSLRQRLQRLFALCYQRRATDGEVALLESAVSGEDADAGWVAVAQALLLSNEFVFID